MAFREEGGGRRLSPIARRGVAVEFALARFGGIDAATPTATKGKRLVKSPAMQSANFTNQFLIAMPVLTDPYFAKSLVYVCEHNERGALGIIVNRPLDMTLGTLFERVELALDNAEISKQPVYFGGPVQTDRGFVLHRPAGEWQSNLKVGDDIAMTSSRDILQSIAAHGTPTDILVTLGFSGWSAGQLENEIVQNAWLSVAADPHILFELPYEERLPAAMQILGIDFTSLSNEAGHA